MYKDEKHKMELKEERVEDEEVILIKLCEVSESTLLSTKSSFIDNEVNNLIKYMKFIHFPIQTRIFQPPPYYQSLQSRGEQNPEFWKEVAIALVKNNHNTKMSKNGYSINMYQEEPLHELYFISIDNREQVIISPNKKMVATYVVAELEVLMWFMRIWMLKRRYYYNQCLLDATWIRIEGNDTMISCTKVVSVSTSCSKYSILAWFSLFYDSFDFCMMNAFLMANVYI